MLQKKNVKHYLNLIRADRPIGWLLLLWPTLWALWIAGSGSPSIKNIIVFVLGVLSMRAAGCIINDLADQNFDKQVKRTKSRPLTTQTIAVKEAFFLLAILLILAFLLVLLTNKLTIMLSLVALLLAAIYPFMKRFTHLPQVILGAAFGWAVPMAFAAELNTIPKIAWLLFLATLLWTVTYDTFYAMVDRDDDSKIGLKSTAILFGDADLIIIGILQFSFIGTMILVGLNAQLTWMYYAGLCIAIILFIYQLFTANQRNRENYFKAFLNNNWVGVIIFVGLIANYWFN